MLPEEPLYDEDDPYQFLDALHDAFAPTRFTYLKQEVPVVYLLAKRTVPAELLAAETKAHEEVGECRILEVTEDEAELQRMYLEEWLQLAAPDFYYELEDARADALEGVTDR
jgi:hypothetical protein